MVPGVEEPKYREKFFFFFQNLLIVHLNVRAISGEDFDGFFAPKKVW